MKTQQQTKSRIEEIVFHVMKISDEKVQQRIIKAVPVGVADRDFTLKQAMAHALLTVFHQNPAFFLLGVMCLTFILPTLILIKIFG